jgi:coenzyme F420 hydrogenase subunit beta
MTGFDLLESHVLKSGICCGCGGCAGICPKGSITMEFDERGEYRPRHTEECSQCGLCAKVCPFFYGNPGMDDVAKDLFGSVRSMRHTKETGYYHRCFVGFAPEAQLRQGGASGGILTWVLCELLRRKEIDFVVTASPNAHPDKLFHYAVLDSIEQIRACSKSVYYPLELSEVLRTLTKKEGRYAVVGLPCVLKAFRNMQSRSPLIRNRVVYSLGLVCGRNKSRLFTEALVRHAGMEPSRVQSVCFRDKTGTDKASYFYFSAQDGSQIKRLNFYHIYGKIFRQPWFDLGACRVCDDIFAECADAAFMDAWLPEYISDVKGTSLILSRKERLSLLVSEVAKDIPVEKIVESQRGVVLHKRRFLDWEIRQVGKGIGRVHLALAHGKKRYLPNHWFAWRRVTQARRLAAQIRGTDNGNVDWFEEFRRTFALWQRSERIYLFINRMLRIPSGGFRRLGTVFQGGIRLVSEKGISE